jgi:tRNA/rRNA methyltransferase
MKISFVLVEPAVPENVGAAARAINTMGFTNLLLVNPCDYLSDKSLMLAHGSHSILHNAQVFGSLSEAIKAFDFTIATSAKSRWVKQDIVLSTELAQFIENKSDSISSIAIVFGCEESGLSNDDIALCDIVTSVPIANAYPSLNLSQAVMVFAYALMPLTIKPENTELSEGINNHGYKALCSKVISTLNNIGLTNESLVHGRVLERLSQISDEDVNLLHSVTSKLTEFINSKENE